MDLSIPLNGFENGRGYSREPERRDLSIPLNGFGGVLRG